MAIKPIYLTWIAGSSPAMTKRKKTQGITRREKTPGMTNKKKSPGRQIKKVLGTTE